MAASAGSVEQLLETVKRLPPEEFAEFAERLAQWQGPSGGDETAETDLVAETRVRLPATEARRLQTLAARSERGELSAAEQDEYRDLAAKAERIGAKRVHALAELARRRQQSVDQVKRDVGWREDRHGA